MICSYSGIAIESLRSAAIGGAGISNRPRTPYIGAMTHLFRTVGMLCAAAALASPAAAMPDGRAFAVVNKNGSAAIEHVWLVPIATNADWTEIRLDYPIKPNNRSPFAMAAGDACLYNIKVRFSDGSEQAFENVNVCRGDEVTAT